MLNRSVYSFSRLGSPGGRHVVGSSIISNDNLRLAIVMAKQISRVRILRDADGEVEDVAVGDSLAEILDVDANITARCDLPQLETRLRAWRRLTMEGITKL